MFLVKTYLAESKIHGIGLFAYEDIAKGTKIYQPSPDLDLSLSLDQYNKLDRNDQKVIKHYGYLSKHDNKYYLAYDNIRFCNHSKKPNVALRGDEYFVARNIRKGEELLCDYSEFEELRDL